MDFYSFLTVLVADGIGIAMSCTALSIYLMLKENQKRNVEYNDKKKNREWQSNMKEKGNLLSAFL
jgi:hypothetical protein